MRKFIMLINLVIISESHAQLSPKPIIAEYIGQDLCVINSYPSSWNSYGQNQTYSTIYYDKKLGKYYGIIKIKETNNIYYTYNPKKQEKIFKGKDKKFAQKNSNRELYLGNLSQYERVYIDTNNNKLYVKILFPKQLQRYNARDPECPFEKVIFDQPLKDNKLYPAMLPSVGYRRDPKTKKLIMYTNMIEVGYTNKSGQKFISLCTEKPPLMTPKKWEEYNRKFYPS